MPDGKGSSVDDSQGTDSVDKSTEKSLDEESTDNSIEIDNIETRINAWRDGNWASRFGSLSQMYGNPFPLQSAFYAFPQNIFPKTV